MGGAAHLVQVLRLVGLNLRVQVRQPGHRRPQAVLQTAHALPLPFTLRFRRRQLLPHPPHARRQLRDTPAHSRQPHPRLRQLRVQVRRLLALVADAPLRRLDPLPGLHQLRFLDAQLLVQLREHRLQPLRLRLPACRLTGPRLQFGLLPFQCVRLRRQLPGQLVTLLQTQGNAQLTQPAGVLLVALCLGRLQFHAAQLLLHLVDDVAQPLHVLIDALQFAQRLGLAGLEAADAGRLLEDGAPVLRGRLQQHVHAALLDDAVSVRAGAAAQEQVLDVLEPADLLVDEVFALAAAVDAARDLHFLGVGGQDAAAVVKGHGDLRQAQAAPRRRAVEDHVRHLAAAQALGALLAQNPAHRIDNVRLTRPIWSHNCGDAVAEVEDRPVCEALEARQFESLEHGASSTGAHDVGPTTAIYQISEPERQRGAALAPRWRSGSDPVLAPRPQLPAGPRRGGGAGSSGRSSTTYVRWPPRWNGSGVAPLSSGLTNGAGVAAR